jgi:hypothetical protein
MTVDSLQEVTLRVLVMYRPPVVDDDIKDRQDDNKEGCRPFGLETDSNHDAGGQAHKGEDESSECPFTLKSYTNK